MKGFVRIKCANCGMNDRAEVCFPVYNKGFEPKEHECHYCGTVLIITDPHVYDGKGRISEEAI